MKKKYYWLIGIVLILIITNPSMSDFKDYIGTYFSKADNMDLSKTANYFLFSRYDDGTDKYIGILKNFYAIGHYDAPPPSAKVIMRDSAAMADSAKMAEDTSKIKN